MTDPRTRRRLRVAFTLAGAVLAIPAGLAGCPGSLQDPERFDTDGAACPDVGQTVVQQVCAAGQCHSAAVKQGGLDSASPDVASRLVGVSAMGGPGLLVDPTNPQDSVLYQKLTASPPYGARMPFGETPLDPTTIACMLGWIDGLIAGDAGADGSLLEADGSSLGDDGSSPSGDGTGIGDGSSGGAPSDSGGSGQGTTTNTTPDASHGTTPSDAGVHSTHDASTHDASSSVPDATAPEDAGASDDADTD